MNRYKPSIWKNLNPRPLGYEATNAALRAMKPQNMENNLQNMAASTATT